MEPGGWSRRCRRAGVPACVGLFPSFLLLSSPSIAGTKVAKDSADRTGLLVTVAARECPTYQDVRANLARNNIMESLQDLGEDTLYTSGEPINPKLELEGQPKCKLSQAGFHGD